ncbi:hypothetical protein RSOL_147850, partial [Rhizoctonia solani AG-3 Rhs1AP]
MVDVYGPRETRDEAVAYLTGVGNALGEGGITLDDALSELEDTLASHGFSAASEQQLDEARESYTRQFGLRDQTRITAQNAGQQPPPQPGNPAPPPVVQRIPSEALLSRPVTPMADRAGPRANTTIFDDDYRDYLEWRRTRKSAEEPAASKKRPYPWLEKLTVDADPSLHPNVAKTRRLTIEYVKDLDAAKSTLYDVSNLPAVPDAVWKSVLKNEFVDLDKIHSAYTSVVNTKKHAEKLVEGIYIQTESDTPTKSIARDSDWLQSFRLYSRAVALVYPHRVDELNAWESAMGEKFRVFNPNVHKSLFRAEAAARRKIFDSTSQTLFDTHVLEVLVPAWISPDGQEHSSSANGSGSSLRQGAGRSQSGTSKRPQVRKGSSPQICITWNSGTCKQPDNCRYRHVCLGCSGDHPKINCPKTSK